MSACNSKHTSAFEDDEIFDDSTFLANFDNVSFKQTKVSESNVNGSLNTSVLNVSALCCDEEISGYDKITGQTWIYPTNYPVRDYQYNIIKSAILKNTLVSLPTGLGKTFIAAVIMYNFFRWYPLGKIVFTAPTRPLVAQQIDACYNIVAIPPCDTIEMTGHMQVATRKTHWQSKRVFFATPQVIYNDLKSGICPADKIRCLVIDEAHRARGNYAYCQIVGALDDLGHKIYRLLALSATPGSKVEDVISVVKSLHIHHLELRTEDCIDVAPYSHSRKISSVVIPLGPELSHLRQQYVEILDFYARRLKQFNILPQNLGNLSKGRIVMLYKEYQTRDRGTRHPQHTYIMRDFTMLIALYHGLELLVKHGSRVFLNFFDEHPEKSWIQSDDKLTSLLERLRDDLGVNPLALDRSILPDGTIPEIPSNLRFGHPKFDKLKEIMVQHFTNAKMKQQDTKAIVFCEYRESVNLVHCLLLQCRPLIVPLMFVGQGASGGAGRAAVSQKQQLRTMRGFRAGAGNALVATCVAEEGLDVGSVDLIVCFDVSSRSPVRLVQRCGRTGRERGGQVFILVTEGKEHQTLQDCMRQRDGLNKKIQQSREVQNNLYKSNPRMIPHGFTPQIQKMYITVATKDELKYKPTKKAQIEKAGKGQKDLRTMLASRASTSNATPSNMIKLNLEESQQSVDTEFEEITVKKVEPMAIDEPIIINSQDTQAQTIVAPSPVKIKQTKKKQKVAAKSPAKNYGDIRALFSTATKSTKSYTKLINELGVNDSGVPTKLINLLVDLNLDSSSEAKTCYICQYICDCKTMKYTKDTSKPVLKFVTEPLLPNIDLINDMDTETISKCGNIENNQDIVENISREISDASKSSERIDKANCSANFDLELDFDEFDDKTLDGESKAKGETNFDIGYIDDLFADISPEQSSEKELKIANETAGPNERPKETEEALGFFGLDSIDDIFASDDSIIQVSPEPPKVECQATKTLENNIVPADKQNATDPKKQMVSNMAQPLSPSILSGQLAKTRSTSPILCSQASKFQPSKKNVRSSCSTPNTSLRKNLLAEYTDHKNAIVIDEKSNATNKSMLTITQLVDMINKTQNKSLKESNVTTNQNIVISDEDRSTSPILLTQAERAKSINISRSKSNNKSVNKSLIILDSDSDSNEFNDTQVYDYYKELNKSDTSKTPQCKITQSKMISFFDAISDEKVESAPKKSNIFNTETMETIAYDTKSKTNTSPIAARQKFTEDVPPEANLDAKPKETQIDVRNKIDTSPVLGKRKFDDEDSKLITASPYFNKKQKIEDASEKPLTLQQKVLAAISSNKNKLDFTNNLTNYHCTVSQPNFSQKENTNPANKELNKSIDNVRPLQVLQKYKKDSKILSLRKKFSTIFKKSPTKSPVKISPIKNHAYENSEEEFLTCEDFSSPKKSLTFGQKKSNKKKYPRTFEDSDDDFINDKSGPSSPKRTANADKVIKSTTNHKVRKKKRKNNSLLDMEAALSDSDSGDELTDDSAGSIAEFICDDDVTHHGDMQAVYLKSIRSPVRKNGFKIPELPKFNKIDVFSQFVAEDSYEMDSFCVDSHVGLTQDNDMTELELVEIALDNNKRKKKHRCSSPEPNESPLIKRKYKKVKRLNSDSEDSS